MYAGVLRYGSKNDFTGERYSVILLDLMLPGNSGGRST